MGSDLWWAVRWEPAEGEVEGAAGTEQQHRLAGIQISSKSDLERILKVIEMNSIKIHVMFQRDSLKLIPVWSIYC